MAILVAHLCLVFRHHLISRVKIRIAVYVQSQSSMRKSTNICRKPAFCSHKVGVKFKAGFIGLSRSRLTSSPPIVPDTCQSTCSSVKTPLLDNRRYFVEACQDLDFFPELKIPIVVDNSCSEDSCRGGFITTGATTACQQFV